MWLIELLFGKWTVTETAIEFLSGGFVYLSEHSVTKRKRGHCDFPISGYRRIPVDRAEKLIKQIREKR